MSIKANSTFTDAELKNHPIDEAFQLTPHFEIDMEKKTFHFEINFPDFSDNEIKVIVNGGKISINAVSEKLVENVNLCKVHRLSINLPANTTIKDFERVFEKGELKLKGRLVDQTSNETKTEK